MKCPYCGRDVIYSDRFCKCGAELDMVVCPNCGTPNITLATFCGNCGHFLAGAEPYVPEPEEVDAEEPEEAASIPEQEAEPEEEFVPEQEPEEPVEPEPEPEPEEPVVPKPEPEPEEPVVSEQEPEGFVAPEPEPEPEEPVMQETEPEPEPEEPVVPEPEPEPEEPVITEPETEPEEPVVSEQESKPEPEEPVVPEPESEPEPEENRIPEQEPAGFVTPGPVPVSEENIIPEQEPEPEGNVVSEQEPEPEENIVPEQEPEPEENIVPEQEPEPVENIVPEQEPEEEGISDQVSEEDAVSESEPEAAAMEEDGGGGKRRRGGLIALWIVIAIIVVIVIVFLVWFNRGNRDQNTQDENTENMSDAEEEDLNSEENGEEETEVPASVSDVAFERKNTDDNYEYAELTATDDAGNVVWEYTTPMYPDAELDRVSPIGLHGSSYFLIQDGAVVALDKSNGDVLWENGDYGGTPVDHSWDYASDGLYLCGYNGPAIYAVSYDGETLGKIDAFDNLTEETETNLWPYKVYVSGREATVLYGPENVLQESDMAITEDEATVYSVNLDTWEYNLIRNGAPKAEDTSDNNENGDNGESDNGENGSENNGDNGTDNNGGSDDQSAAQEVNMSDVTNVTASSYLYEPNVNISHDPKYLVDGSLQDAWCEDASGDGSGEWAKIDFNGTYIVSGMNINAGYQKSESLYYQNGRPKDLTITFSDGSYIDATLEDVNGQQTVTFPNPVNTSSVTITIRSVYNGSKYEDTCISEVAFY